MSTDAKTAKRLRCASCDNKAKRVSPITLRALLTDEFATQIGADDQSCCDSNGEGCKPITGDAGWRFCDSTDCDVVYFAEDGDTTFTKSQLKVPVGVKETSGDRPLCYCFGHSMASINEELRKKGASTALEDIRAKRKNPGCRCETENPSGSCCLGSIGKGIKIAQEELEMKYSDIQTPPSPAKSSGGSQDGAQRISSAPDSPARAKCDSMGHGVDWGRRLPSRRNPL